MNLSDFFDNLIQLSDGNDTMTLIQNVPMNAATTFHVNAKGYSKDILDLFVASNNCSIVFHENDGYSKPTRVNFLNNLPISSNPEQVIIMSENISDADLKVYTALGARIFMTALSNNVDQLIAIGKTRIEVVKGDLSNTIIQSLTDQGATIV